MIVYGLKNCDTCRRARRWLADAGADHGFVDLRAEGIGEARLRDWIARAGWPALLNRRSRTWRELPADQRDNLDAERAAALMQAHPTLIKRPVMEIGDDVILGFDADRYAAALAGGGG